MTNKSTKRALFASVMALILCFTMLLGTTFAWFTDSVTSSGNKIVAGELDVQLWMHDGTDYKDISDNANPIFGEGSIAQNLNAETLWEPGKTQVAYLAIKNGGSLDLKYTVGLNVQNVSKDLYEVMEYAIVPDAQPVSAPVNEWTSGNSVVVGTQSVSGDVELKVGETHYFALVIHMDEDADSDYMKGAVKFDLTVLATQLDSEHDAFGPDYDEDADYAVKVSTVEDLQRALIGGGNITLVNDITLTAADLTNAPDLASIPVGLAIVGTSAILDLNGHDIIIEAQDGVAIHVKDGTLDIIGEGKISNTGTSGYVVWAKGDATVNVQNGAFFAGGDDTTLFYASGTVAYDPNSDWATINIYGGTFDNEAVGDSVQDYMNVMNHGVGRINIYGGTFDFDPANTAWGDDAAYIKVAPTYEVVDNNDGTYTVVRSKIVNLTEDISDKIVIGEEEEMTLNLGSNALNNTLTNTGDVTVNGGEINVSGDNALYNEGSAELKNVTINMTNSTGYITNSRTEGSVTIYEGVTATSSGGGVNVWEGEAIFKSGTITTNSTSTSARHMFYVASGAKLTIEDGEFIFNPTNLTRKGSYICAQANATVVVNGGTFHAPSTRTAPIQALDGSDVKIYGGTFQFDPSAFVADGYVAVESNGWWTVSAE